MHGVGTDDQSLGDLRIAKARGDEREDLPFAVAKGRNRAGDRRVWLRAGDRILTESDELG
jgi:hypothetical protein